MLDTTIRKAPGNCGLTALEQRRVRMAEASLPAGWRIVPDENDVHEVYARVVPPWNTDLSAFLIDREGHGIILTDNISVETHPVISVVWNIQDAIDHIAAVLFGHGGRTGPAKAAA